MEEVCRNCDELLEGEYCSNCGQKSFRPIDKKYLIEEVKDTLQYTSRGLFYSLKRIMVRPGQTALEFVEGKRINHYKPLALVFVLATVAVILTSLTINQEAVDLYYADRGIGKEFANFWTNFTTRYFAAINVLVIPVFALATKISFKKWGHNYYEHVILNAYVYALITVYSIVLLLPTLIFRNYFSDNMELYMNYSSITYLIVPFFLVWFFKGVYPEKPLMSVIGKILLTMLLSVVFLSVLFVVFVILLFIYFEVFGGGASQYLSDTPA